MLSRRALTTMLVLLAGVASAAIVACGGADAGQGPGFAQQYRALQTRYRPVGVEIVATLQTAPDISDDTLAVILRDEGRRLGELHDKLADLTPPGGANSSYRAYLSDLTTATADLNRLGFNAGTHNAQSARDETQRLIDDLREGRNTRIRFERAAGITKS